MASPSPASGRQLVDMLKRLEHTKAEGLALLIRLSSLNPGKNPQNHIKITLSALNGYIIDVQAQLFLLSNNDIVILDFASPVKKIEELASTVRKIFQSDAFVASYPEKFAEVYPLSTHIKQLSVYVQKYATETPQLQNEPKKEVPLAPEHLDAILRNIQGFNILKIIRRQEAIQITPQGKLSSLFLEYFTSMADLKKAIAPDVNVLSNRWLFQHLSETLDKRMLGSYKELFAHTPKNISLNLNISSLLSPAFENFLNEIPEGKSVIVEVQLMDIIQNTRNYMTVRNLLHEAGHYILIDGLHAISFEFMDINLLDPDFMKLNWSPAILQSNASAKLTKHLDAIDPEKLIMMRCEDESSLAWALMHRITRFQGYFIDALTSAKIRKTCPEKKNCTKQQCSARKACIAGALRAECLMPENLDHPIEFKRKKTA